MRVIQSKFTKTNSYFFQKGGGGGAHRSWIRLCYYNCFKRRVEFALFILTLGVNMLNNF